MSGMKKLQSESGRVEEDEGLPQNHISIFKGLPNFLTGGFFKSEWSFGKIKINEGYAKVSFINSNTLVAITPKGHDYKIEIDLKKEGDWKIIEKGDIFKKEKDD